MRTPNVEKLLNGGVQRIYTFPNGYGASVVRHNYSYGGANGLWKLAVLSIESVEPLEFELTYSTPITGDVLGHLSEQAVDELLNEIENLEVAN